MSQVGQVQRCGQARGATVVPIREGGVRLWRQGLTPHSSVVAWSVEGSLEGGEEKGARVWAFESCKEKEEGQW